MFNMFRKFACCKKPARVCRCTRCAKCARELIDINEITYDKLLDKVKGGAVLIDVRTKQEFLEEHLKGAILIPYYEISKKIVSVVPNKDETIVVYCKNGGRSARAYEKLNKLGYSNIYNLKDGMEGI